MTSECVDTIVNLDHVKNGQAFKDLSQEQIDKIYSIVFASVQESARTSKVDLLKWSYKHHKFFEAGKNYPERAFTAGNRCAKTSSCAAELSFHLTGLYPQPGESFPDGWKGRKFNHPIDGCLLSNTTKQLRTAAQRILVGKRNKKTGKWEGGMIPSHLMTRVELVKGVADAIDFIEVKHVSGGTSTIYLKSTEMDWESIQGMELHFFWMDEEPKVTKAINIYHEVVPRLITTNGIYVLTATPQRQMTELMAMFWGIDFTGEGIEEDEAARYRILITMTIWEANHLTEEQRRRFEALIPPYLRDSRLKGIPSPGMGMIYDVPESVLGCDSFDVSLGSPHALMVNPFNLIPDSSFRFIVGMDLGFSNSYSAFVWMVYDSITKTIYAFDCFMARHQTPRQIAPALKKWDKLLGFSIPVSWPKDVGDQGRTEGEVAKDLYVTEGINMLPICAAVEVGESRSRNKDDMILNLWNKMTNGQFKVFKDGRMSPWWNQWKMYRIDETGKIVKSKKHQFDLMDATENGAAMVERYGASFNSGMMLNLQTQANIGYDPYSYGQGSQQDYYWNQRMNLQRDTIGG